MYYIYVNFCRVDTPYTFEEAMESKDRENWIKAMDNEIESLNDDKTWYQLMNEKIDILEVKWVYTRKSNDVFKAKLVVTDFQQSNVINDIYVLVAKTQTLKTMLSFCCQSGFIIEQIDVVTAFLNGIVSSEVYQST